MDFKMYVQLHLHVEKITNYNMCSDTELYYLFSTQEIIYQIHDVNLF